MNAKTPNTKALVALENVADLPKGRSLVIEGLNRRLNVKRTVDDRSWILQLEGDRQHARWCDSKAELLEDLEYFYQSDALPVAKQQWF